MTESNKMLVALDGRGREILRLRFGLDRDQPRTVDEVGRVFSLTRERIRQIEAWALSKLGHPSLDHGAHGLPNGSRQHRAKDRLPAGIARTNSGISCT